MGRLIVEQIVTVDGYAADPDGGIEFFEALTHPGENGEPNLNDDEQLAYVSQAEAILFGAVTYGMFADYWPKADPEAEHVAELINRLPKFVVSNTLTEAPWGDDAIEILQGDGAEAAAALKERFGTIIVWGSLTLADALLRAGLVDELHLRVVPVLLGDGRSVTPADLGERRLELDRIVARPGGTASLRYLLR